MNPTMLGLLWYMPSLLGLMTLGAYLAWRKTGGGRGGKEALREMGDRFRESLAWTPGYISLLVLVMAGIKAENIIQDHVTLSPDYTPLIYSIEGNGHIIFLQNYFGGGMFLHGISVFYLLFFIYLIVIVPLILMLWQDRETMRFFTYGMVLQYLVLIPAYLFFNVSVTSMYPPDTQVKALLYDNQMYLGLVHLVDRLNDCFPSGHISVTLFITLVAYRKIGDRWLTVFSLLVFLLTAFSILYLGIHWVMDIIGGVALGLWAYLFVEKDILTGPLDRFADKVNTLAGRLIGGSRISPGSSRRSS
ncbi:MAG: inositol phosphorylceramide synthase [Thermoplasmata archaeon]|nr:inositol phosphorylceramide synthase [Thermoplasmata archaeon]